MPPKKKFSTEQIIEAAWSIAKEEGIDSMTIRKVADRLGSSIAPIYVNFSDVEELKQAVVKKVSQIGQQMIHEQNTGSPFGDIGAASLQFAQEYPALVRDLAMKPNDYLKNYDQDMGTELVNNMKTDPELAGFEEQELRMILLKMRAFQTGLTMMVVNRQLPPEFDLKSMRKLLDSVAEDVVIAAKLRKQEDSSD
ncbi:TetR/AcrR family transcriptional regulator [Shouchella clausii]|jgi:AcrR family transcriptional regulator|uniref:TetR/AcrR family transcriptional regulator n=1 Tax=Shouchella clausii TaxID=79880 RepID=UPI000B97836C|nr:TetR/AcrR family transcriptional regulator [Shouchella clausii]SPT79177.1 TetR family transcriptional regulator [Niallia circulans]AST95190.1 TetR family transcriptional regulator [Shouchella clausii]MBU8595592.1 TetR/AcrR family transcriptional regulator [Shouchella clausii]MCR1289687.1 TetR/AcrR family transcriptional regulator [Shouchella clausii]MCY1106277.1 TetR/AcrR family transcriptional regulator [Shouchella clausii]